MKSRTAWLGLVLAVSAAAAPPALTDKALWDEFGLQQSEQTGYATATGQRVGVVAYRFKDPTGALAAFEWQRPAGAKPSRLAPVAAETSDGALALYHNYLLQFTGPKPEPEDFQSFTSQLRNVHTGPLPILADHLPQTGRIANSDRYVVGPVGLERFLPGISPALAGFDLAAEAAVIDYRTKTGPVRLAVFSYPTPQIARLRLAEFQKLSGALARRAGPMVAVVVPPAAQAAAERLLSQVRYEGHITLSERVLTARDNPGEMLIAIFTLTGILLIPCVLGGLVVGLLRWWVRRSGAQDPMILLHLGDRR